MLTGIFPFSHSTEVLKGKAKLLLDSQFVTSVLPKPTPASHFLGLLLSPAALLCFALLSMP